MANGVVVEREQDVITLLWGARQFPRRGPRPTLRRESIAEAGIGLADAEGVEAVTMQRVAAALEVTKMALYRYVPGKSALLALMTDVAIGAPEQLSGIRGGWRGRLERWTRAMLERFRAHPWLLLTTNGERAFGPNELGWIEQLVATLEGTGLEGGERLDVAAVLAGHVRSLAAMSVAGEHPEAGMRTRLTELISRTGVELPALSAAIESATAGGGQDQAFEFGLQRILDGVAVLIERRGESAD